jgi:hypothetical protein
MLNALRFEKEKNGFSIQADRGPRQADVPGNKPGRSLPEKQDAFPAKDSAGRGQVKNQKWK